MKNVDKAKEAYSYCRYLLDDCRTLKSLEKAVDNIMAISRQHKFDEYQMEALERFGMKRYEQIQREMTMLVKNRKFG